jgi:putative FmdB family regulatory protein
VPTYEYRCKSCSHEFEIVQSFSEDALTTCEECGGPLRKVFGNVGISFKGNGFYKNDSRGKTSSTASSASSSSESSSSSSGDSSTSSGSDSSSTSSGGDSSSSSSTPATPSTTPA